MDVNKSEMQNKNMIAFLFDTGKIEEAFYGDVVFKNFIDGMEITANKYKTVFSEGDILDRRIHVDTNPFIVRDRICTIGKDNQEKFKGMICVLLVEDIETEIAINIDKRMTADFPAYIGMTSVDSKSTDKRKQFWKSLIRTFSVEYMTITFFNSADGGDFNYYDTALSKGFHINCDGFPYDYYSFEDGILFSTRQSSFISNIEQLNFWDGENDADRGIMDMNFSLVKEVGIAGVQIWKAIEDIDNTYIPKDNNNPLTGGQIPTEYIFTSLYQAAQGMERLLKVILELIMYGMEEDTEKEKVKRLLMSHNHPAMWGYIENKENIKLKSLSKRLLNTLYDFYNKARYHRYKDGVTDVLELNIMQIFGKDLDGDDFDKKIKHLYGKALGQISQTLYGLIRDVSGKLNIYVYELDYTSTANYVLNSYYGEDLYDTLERIKLSKKELLWYLICKGNELSSAQFIEDFPELSFEECMIPHFLKDLLCSVHSNYELYNFVDNEYDELVQYNKKQWKERIEYIDALVGNTNFYFDIVEETDE